MEGENKGNSTSKTEHLRDLNDKEAKRSVIVGNLPAKATERDFTIHFQRKENCGGDIQEVLLNDENAVIIFDEVEVAENVIKKEQKFQGVTLDLTPYIKENNTAVVVEKEVFSLVSAKINPERFNFTPDKLKELLGPIANEINIAFIELCDGFWISGTYSQIQKTCLKLSSFATPNGTRNTASSSKEQSGVHKDEQQYEPSVVDVLPEMMYILRKEIQQIKDKYHIKVEHNPKTGKAILSPLGSEESFTKGKDEFIDLYQKNYQLMEKKTLELATDESTFKQLSKELTEKLNVMIERRGNQVAIYGKSEHVTEAMLKLQGKHRRGRRPVMSDPTKDVLPKPDIAAQTQLPAVLRHTLENGITVSVYQGDLTKQNVDAIVNAANERLDHCGGLAGDIVKQGGYQIQQESTQLVQRYGFFPVGNVAYTKAGKLPCKMILHAVGPQWSVHGPDGCRRFIYNACFNSLMCAQSLGFTSIAIPAISSGIFGVPVEICAEMLFAAAEMFSCEVTSNNQLQDIRFVNIDAPTNDAMRREFCKRYGYSHVGDNRPERALNNAATSFSNGFQTRRTTTNYTDDKQPVKGINSVNNSNKWADKKTVEHNGRNPSSNASREEGRTMTDAGAAAPKTGEKTTDKIISNTVTAEGRHPTHPSALAAIKREQEAKLSLEASQSSDGASPSFDIGFKTRQTETQRLDENINKASKTVKDSNIKSEVSRSIYNKEEHNKHDKKESRVNQSENKPADQTENTAQDKMKDPHKDDKTMQDASPKGTVSPQGVSGKSDVENKMRGSGRGRGRGAMAITQTNFAPQFPGKAMRINGSSKKDGQEPTQIPKDQKQPKENLNLSQTKCSSEQQTNNSDEPAKSRDQREIEETTDLPQPKGSSVEQTAEFTTNESSPQSNSSPPGLHITKEGLELASDCKVESAGPAEDLGKQPSQKNTQDPKSTKRKMTDPEGSLNKSPKQRKEEIITVKKSEETMKGSQDSTLKKEGDEVVKDDKEETDLIHDEKEKTRTPSDYEQKNDASDESNDSSKENQEGDEAGSEKTIEQTSTTDQNMDAQTDKPAIPETPNQDKDDKYTSDQLQPANNDRQAESANKLKEDNGIHRVGVEKEDQDNLDPTTQPDESGQTSDSKNEQDTKEHGTETTSAHDSEQSVDANTSHETDHSLSSYEVVNHPENEKDNSEKAPRCTRVSEGSSSSESIVFIDQTTADDHEMIDDIELNKTNQNGNKIVTDGEDSKACNPDDQRTIEGGVTSGEDKQNMSEADTKNVHMNRENTLGTVVEVRKVDIPKEVDSIKNESKASDGDQPKSDGQTEAPKDNEETATTLQTGDVNDDHTSEIKDKGHTVKTVKELSSDDSRNEDTNKIEEILQNEEEHKLKEKGASNYDELAEAMGSLSLGNDDDKTSKDNSTPPLRPSHQDDCRLCNTAFPDATSTVILSGCGHMICQDCQVKHQHLKPFICSICEKTAGCNDLQPPGGKIKFGELKETGLGGSEGHTMITVDYEFPAGIQGSCHPYPGQCYQALERRTFLPDTPEGQEVQKMLKKAFGAGALFTIKDDKIEFSEGVEHKMNLCGGQKGNGYPDPGYVDRVTKQLHDILEIKTAPPTARDTSQD